MTSCQEVSALIQRAREDYEIIQENLNVSQILDLISQSNDKLFFINLLKSAISHPTADADASAKEFGNIIWNQCTDNELTLELEPGILVPGHQRRTWNVPPLINIVDLMVIPNYKLFRNIPVVIQPEDKTMYFPVLPINFHYPKCQKEDGNLSMADYGALIVLNAPSTLEVKVDLGMWPKTYMFKGVRFIPPGKHYFSLTEVRANGAFGNGVLITHIFSKGEVVIFDWNSPELEPENINAVRINLDNTLDQLDTYPFQWWKLWISNSCFIHGNLFGVQRKFFFFLT